jgi:hypothetical protein
MFRCCDEQGPFSSNISVAVVCNFWPCPAWIEIGGTIGATPAGSSYQLAVSGCNIMHRDSIAASKLHIINHYLSICRSSATAVHDCAAHGACTSHAR